MVDSAGVPAQDVDSIIGLAELAASDGAREVLLPDCRARRRYINCVGPWRLLVAWLMDMLYGLRSACRVLRAAVTVRGPREAFYSPSDSLLSSLLLLLSSSEDTSVLAFRFLRPVIFCFLLLEGSLGVAAGERHTVSAGSGSAVGTDCCAGASSS